MVTIAFDLDRPIRSLAYIVLSGVYLPRRVRLFFGRPSGELFEELKNMTEARALRPVTDSVYALDDIVGAHTRLEAGGVRGKVVIRVDAAMT
ncbi:MAG TPA: zinc-binding dehydrogenase [Candidatus Microbacterium pullistercoris]|nr:zinc-binding dehydrogenase [Candidatus Microbacterium pullistercoris]